jgi:Flp pilus assembly protein TadG
MPRMERPAGRGRGDRGDVSLQIVLLTPVVLFLVLVIVQAALWYHAVQLADNAAADGASTAARHGAASADGAAAIADFVSDSGGRLVVGQVSGDSTVMVATATVHVPHVIPGWPESVTRRATAPVERLTNGGG